MIRNFYIFAALFFAGCDQATEEARVAEYIHFRTGDNSSTLLVGQDYKGKHGATETFRYRNPTVALHDSYIEITYPGTDYPKQVIPRESLIEMAWK